MSDSTHESSATAAAAAAATESASTQATAAAAAAAAAAASEASSSSNNSSSSTTTAPPPPHRPASGSSASAAVDKLASSSVSSSPASSPRLGKRMVVPNAALLASQTSINSVDSTDDNINGPNADAASIGSASAGNTTTTTTTTTNGNGNGNGTGSGTSTPPTRKQSGMQLVNSVIARSSLSAQSAAVVKPAPVQTASPVGGASAASVNSAAAAATAASASASGADGSSIRDRTASDVSSRSSSSKDQSAAGAAAGAVDGSGADAGGDAHSKSSNPDVLEGYLHRKLVMEGGKKSKDRSWNKLYFTLKGNELAAYKDHYAPKLDPTKRKDAAPLRVLDVSQCVAEIAYSYRKRPNVFSVSTVQGEHYLLQAFDQNDMLAWVKRLHEIVSEASDVMVSIMNKKALVESERHQKLKKADSIGSDLDNVGKLTKASSIEALAAEETDAPAPPSRTISRNPNDNATDNADEESERQKKISTLQSRLTEVKDTNEADAEPIYETMETSRATPAAAAVAKPVSKAPAARPAIAEELYEAPSDNADDDIYETPTVATSAASDDMYVTTDEPRARTQSQATRPKMPLPFAATAAATAAAAAAPAAAPAPATSAADEDMYVTTDVPEPKPNAKPAAPAPAAQDDLYITADETSAPPPKVSAASAAILARSKPKPASAAPPATAAADDEDMYVTTDEPAPKQAAPSAASAAILARSQKKPTPAPAAAEDLYIVADEPARDDDEYLELEPAPAVAPPSSARPKMPLPTTTAHEEDMYVTSDEPPPLPSTRGRPPLQVPAAAAEDGDIYVTSDEPAPASTVRPRMPLPSESGDMYITTDVAAPAAPGSAPSSKMSVRPRMPLPFNRVDVEKPAPVPTTPPAVSSPGYHDDEGIYETLDTLSGKPLSSAVSTPAPAATEVAAAVSAKAEEAAAAAAAEEEEEAPPTPPARQAVAPPQPEVEATPPAVLPRTASVAAASKPAAKPLDAKDSKVAEPEAHAAPVVAVPRRPAELPVVTLVVERNPRSDDGGYADPRESMASIEMPASDYAALLTTPNQNGADGESSSRSKSPIYSQVNKHPRHDEHPELGQALELANGRVKALEDENELLRLQLAARPARDVDATFAFREELLSLRGFAERSAVENVAREARDAASTKRTHQIEMDARQHEVENVQLKARITDLELKLKSLEEQRKHLESVTATERGKLLAQVAELEAKVEQSSKRTFTGSRIANARSEVISAASSPSGSTSTSAVRRPGAGLVRAPSDASSRAPASSSDKRTESTGAASSSSSSPAATEPGKLPRATATTGSTLDANKFVRTATSPAIVTGAATTDTAKATPRPVPGASNGAARVSGGFRPKSEIDSDVFKPDKTYSYQELVKKPFGVNEAMMEHYLSDAEFQELFECTKSEFSKQPKWKQLERKKALRLF
ncbi:hypothetical protein, variant [Capsaspora owczarzaki ATCC 30864]|uniref:PH domain-containing protein n=1 Tax=Capsaspora owczarzaki (strain ATCC 30864) TaxID=595528 RepID=A0A0D2WNG6_CAPO3|nr:hypothetical protein, variant [Capsaspora owczarzaki ATCC 30864]KJE92630.1 hypothetical protein, variant [Capsaspora owczarzaki ATCC 30864]|eukprot:XP_011270315.1 hypothetical protein, variant [Capsaspora owczarzaki ATCC 30864]